MAIYKVLFEKLYMILTLLRMGLFGAALGFGGWAQKGPLPKLCLTYPAMMTLGTVIPYLKKIQKYINHVTRHLSSVIFSPKISKFWYIKKYRYILQLNT